uniref:Reverse transcriptase domain-containing protein n=1 Tax=Tanacetum cinerariifolium TaxID=118510 RepID=A0A6L2MHH4_TANCI|nr:reverse transcriptase domain-containing protein [Tanacetum cinerariifolium]
MEGDETLYQAWEWNVDSSTNSKRIIAIVNKLESLGCDMKKVKDNMHAIQVGCQTCGGAHLDKKCPLNEEVKSMKKVKYGEFDRPFPNNNRNDDIFNRGASGYDQPLSKERRPSLTKTINKYKEEAAKIHSEQDEWLKKFYQNTKTNREAHDKIIQDLKMKVRTLTKEVKGRENDGNERQETDKSGMAEALATLEATLEIKKVPQEEKQSVNYYVDPYEPPISFPRRLEHHAEEALVHKTMESLKKIKINCPLLKEIKKMDNYAKHMKDLVENKPRTKEDEEIRMNLRCSTLLQNQLPLRNKIQKVSLSLLLLEGLKAWQKWPFYLFIAIATSVLMLLWRNYASHLYGRGGPISLIAIQAINFGFKNDMIQQVQNSCHFHGLPGDDANKHLDKLLHVTQSIKVNGVTDDAFRWNSINTFEKMEKMSLGKYFPPSMMTKLRNEITNFLQRLDESLFEACERYKLSIDRCPNHNMLPVTQIDTFYNGLNLRHRDTINAAGGTFMKRRPKECYDLIENMTAHHNDWDTSAKRSESSSTITSSFDQVLVALKAEMAEINKNLMNVLQINQQVKAVTPSCETCGGPYSHGPNPPPAYQASAYQAPGYQALVHQPLIPQPQVVTTAEFTNYMKANDAILKNMQTNMTSLTNFNLELKNMFGQFIKMNTASSSGSGTLPSNTVTNSKEDLKGITTQSGTAYQGPAIPTTSYSLPKVVERETEVTKDTMPPTNNESTKDAQPPIEKALINVFEGELTLRVGKEAITFNLDQTLRYSANYNDMTANRIDVIDMAYEEYSQEILSFSNVIMKVDAFLALEDDPTSPEEEILLLEAFLNDDPSLPPPNKGNYLPQVRKELKICKAKNDKSSIDETPKKKAALIKFLKSHKQAIAWKLFDIKGIDLEFYTHKIIMEDDFKPAVHHQRKVNPKSHNVIKKEVLKLLDAGLIYPISNSPWVGPVHCVPKKGGFTVVENEENELILTRLVTGWRVCIDYRKLNEATRKDHFPLPFMDQMLERLARNEYYCFLDGFLGYFQIPIDPRDQEKTTFTYPYERLPTVTCLLLMQCTGHVPKVYDCYLPRYDRKMIYVFMDDFSVFGNSFGTCLSHLEKMLQRCEDTNLYLNWEKSHFMVKEGIVLGHKISKNEIEVDKAKIDVIAKLPHPTTVKGNVVPTKEQILQGCEALLLGRPLFVQNLCGSSHQEVCSWPGSHLFSRLATMDPPRDIMARTTSPKRCLTLVFIGPQSTVMPTTWSNLVTLVNVKERFCNEMKCLKIPSKSMRIKSSGGVFMARKPFTFSRLATMDPPRDIMARTTPPKRCLTLKWIEAKALPTNDARVVCKFLTSLFTRFGTPSAIISVHGTHFCNDQFTKVMLKYGVTHHLDTPYHPQTSGQVEVSNHSLKIILERTMDENRASWLDKLDDALWAFRTAFKTPIGCTPYKLVYEKACRLPIKLEHKAYWALKHANFDLQTAEKTKRIHDSKIKDRIFNFGDRVLLFNSRPKIFSGKLKTRWSGPFTIIQVFSYGTVELSQTNGPNFKVELKDLPPHLEYAFLEGDDKFPVIFAKDLSDEEKPALKTVLKSHKRAIAWKLFDIKGINPEFCTHKILMEENFKPAV